jgi:2-polyprenyl-6-methoxyphenol hydroxylase-like FAD-dependent oxidoreductase
MYNRFMPASTLSRLPVLIVGAGPTGLTLAAALTRYGVRTRLIESKPYLSRHTKATNLMQRSQEILSALDMLTPLNETGGAMSRLVVHAYGKPFGASTMHLEETPFHDVILCGQDRFEASMARGLAERGVSVEFGVALQSLKQSGGSVVATVESRGMQEEIECEYVVGCDGGAGKTRTFTRNDFTPQKTNVGIRQVDCKLKWRRLSTMSQMWLFYFQNGFAAVVPLPGGIHRILTIEPKPNMPERNPTLEEMQSRIREIAEDQSATLSDPLWFSYTDLAMGIAPGLRDGRVLLAGDAGNPILPNGG